MANANPHAAAPAYVVPHADPAYYPPTAYVVPYFSFAAPQVAARHYSPVGCIYPAMMLPYSFLGADPSTASEAKGPPPAEAELPAPTPVEVEIAPRVAATHYSPVGCIYPAVMLPYSFLGVDPSTSFEAEAPPPAEAELPAPTPAKVEIPCQYWSERLLSKEIRFIGGKIVYIDLQKNRKGLFLQIKDISASRRDYILLDHYFLETDNCTEYLFETRSMRHNNKAYTFTTALLEECLILRIRMVEGNHDHSIAIPVDCSFDHGCAGWSQFGKKLRDVLIEHDITFADHLTNTLESQPQLLRDHPGS